MFKVNQDQFWIPRAEIKAMKAYQIVSDFLSFLSNIDQKGIYTVRLQTRYTIVVRSFLKLQKKMRGLCNNSHQPTTQPLGGRSLILRFFLDSFKAKIQ